MDINALSLVLNTFIIQLLGFFTYKMPCPYHHPLSGSGHTEHLLLLLVKPNCVKVRGWGRGTEGEGVNSSKCHHGPTHCDVFHQNALELHLSLANWVPHNDIIRHLSSFAHDIFCGVPGAEGPQAWPQDLNRTQSRYFHRLVLIVSGHMLYFCFSVELTDKEEQC